MAVRLRSLVLAAAVLLAALPAGASRAAWPRSDPAGGRRAAGSMPTGRSLPMCGKVGMRLVAAAGRQGEPWRFTRARHAGRQRLRAAGRADLRDPRHAGAGGRRGGACGDPRARDRPCARPATPHAPGRPGAAGGRVRRRPRSALELMTRAGYDPAAEADFLRDAAGGTRARGAAGRARDPTDARGGDHPALARPAARRASALGGDAAGRGVRNRDAYLAAIDGHGLGRRAGAGLRARAGLPASRAGLRLRGAGRLCAGQPARRGDRRRPGRGAAAARQPARSGRVARGLSRARLGAGNRPRRPGRADRGAAAAHAARDGGGAGHAAAGRPRQRAGRGADRGSAPRAALPADRPARAGRRHGRRRRSPRRRRASGRCSRRRRRGSSRSESASTASRAATTSQRWPRRCRSGARRGRSST